MQQSHCCEPRGPSPEQAATLNVLDSRAIGRASCFGQRFMRPGTYAYAVVPGHGQALASEHPFLVRVSDEKSSEMGQQDIVVSDHGRGFMVDQPEVSVRVGDMVLWSGNGRTRAPFAIVGEHDFFNSHRMVNECGYSHAFGTAGEFRWVDAFGSGLGGTIRVRDPDGCDGHEGLARWHKQLNEGHVVMIADGRAQPGDLDILVGQTVFFAIVTGPGISITDQRLVDIGKAPDASSLGRGTDSAAA
jgi:plastocyanin